MLLELNKDGTIEHADISLHEGVNFLGDVKGVIDPQLFTVEPADMDRLHATAEEQPHLVYGNAVTLVVLDGRLCSIAPDIACSRDVFYARHPNGRIIVGDAFFSVLAKLPETTQDSAAERFFLKHGYFAPTQTWVNEIQRVRTGCRLVLEGDLREVSLFGPACRGARRSYDDFKRALCSVGDLEGMADGDALLLSSGCDSCILAAMARSVYGVTLHTLTMRYVPALDGNNRDAAVAETISRACEHAHTGFDLEFDALSLDALTSYVEAMPLAAHLSLGYDKLMATAKQLDAANVWCGQNADSLYSLGPTSKLAAGTGKSDLLKRYFLSRGYLQTLSDVEGRGHANALVRAVGQIGVSLLSRRMGTPFTQPRTFQELAGNFMRAENYVALTPAGAACTVPPGSSMDATRAREMLFDEKLASFLVGRDARVVCSAAGLHGRRLVLPYSATNMVLFYRGLEMGWRDVILPKRYHYRLMKEWLGTGRYETISSQLRGRRRLRAPDKDTWQGRSLKETSFWQGLRQAAQAVEQVHPGVVEPDKFQHLVSAYWFQHVREMIQAGGAQHA